MSLKIKIIMMLKNEDDLIWPWVVYHGELVGYENLILFDNGSTSDATLQGLANARSRGVRVIDTYSTAADYRERGELYAGFIKYMDAQGYADFWLPLDADEFIAVDQGTAIACDRASLDAELAPLTYSAHPLLIAEALNNHPLRPGFFLRAKQRKTFFAAHACDSLDHGFHDGRTRSGFAAISTHVVYIHYHYKPFPILIDHAKAKLSPYTDDFSYEGLLQYGQNRMPSFHCVSHLLTSSEDYYAAFDRNDYRAYPEIAEAFAAIGQRLPFS